MKLGLLRGMIGGICGALVFVSAQIFGAQLSDMPPGTPPSAPSLAATLRFIETFDGSPIAPEPFHSDRFDVVVHSRDRSTWNALDLMETGHGPECQPPPATHPGTGRYEDAVFQCANHVMTAIKAGGYGLIYLTPNALVDFSQGEAVIRVDVSTLRASGRDWWDLWLTPFADNLSLPLGADIPDLQGPPRNAVDVILKGGPAGGSRWCPAVVRDFLEASTGCAQPDYEGVLTPSASIRTTFELRVSRTHLKAWLPDHGLVWFDGDIAALPFDRAVVQFGHHSYNSDKDPLCGDGDCGGTWHLDNFYISPAVPFTIVKADRRYVDRNTTGRVNFSAPAPADAYLRFSGAATVEVSFDGGATWRAAQKQAELLHRGGFSSYWMPVPEGIQSVLFRGAYLDGFQWRASDISIWSAAFVADQTPTPVSTPPLTASPQPTSTSTTTIPSPTVVASLTPTAVPTPPATSTPQPLPMAECVRIVIWGSTVQRNERFAATAAGCQ